VVRLVVRNFRASIDPITLLVMFGQPAFLIVILGTMFNQLIPSVGSSGSYIAFLVPGMIASQMITGAVLAGRIFWLDRRWSMVEQIFCGPFLRAEYLAALLLTTEAMVAEKPDEKKEGHGPAGGMPGGMGGMGGMGM